MCIYMQHVVKIMSQKYFTNSMCHTDITISMHHMSQASSTWMPHMQQATWCHELTVSCKSIWHQCGCNTCNKRHNITNSLCQANLHDNDVDATHVTSYRLGVFVTSTNAYVFANLPANLPQLSLSASTFWSWLFFGGYRCTQQTAVCALFCVRVCVCVCVCVCKFVCERERERGRERERVCVCVCV